MFSRFSAFYSPLLATDACGFLAEAGLHANFTVAKSPLDPRRGLNDGSLDLIQSAVSSSWALLERGEVSDIMHFAQINARDGFFLVSREGTPAFRWNDLSGRKVLVDHGGQPLAMFKYACHKMQLDYTSIDAIDAGDPEEMDAAFRTGSADFVHLQGPAPQQLVHEGYGNIVANVGDAIGPVAFSSLAARTTWLETDEAQAFSSAFRKAKQHVMTAPASELAAELQHFFPQVEAAALVQTLQAYQALGCWNEEITIDRAAYATALDVFEYSGLIRQRHPFDKVVVAPPG
ncbi:MAG: ABC transporter substrate-binding protein [Gammaproteobacteria bacterium]